MRIGTAGLVVFFLYLFIGLAVLDRMYPLNIKPKNWSTLVTAKDGTPLRAFADSNGVWRYPVELKEVSPLYLQALLTYEDRWFYSHPGINPFSVIRAFFQNLSSGKIISGGSTLTMQAARLLYPNKRTIAGKCSQMLRALQLEYHLDKDEILSLYVNLAPFGANIEGLQTACFSWLGKQAAELSRAEAALMAVLPQAPSFYRPDRHPERAQKARDKVLDRMETYRVWTKEEVAAAKKEPVAALHFVRPMTAPLAARRLSRLRPGSTRLTATIDYDLQVHLAGLVRDYVLSLPERQSAAVMVINYHTMDVLAYVGSADFLNLQRNGHVDMVQALRSPGSTLKPFLYGLAMDEGLIHSHSLLLDTPRFQRAYDPGNFSKGFSGPVTVTNALRQSLNVPAVQVLEAYGPRKFHDRLVHAGARLSLSGEPNLSMVLGGLGTSLESLITLYSGLARKGIAARPRLLKQDALNERYLMSPGAAWIISRILSQPMPGFEGINRLAGHTPMAWKTGTSYGFRDAWAVGIMGDYVAGVWVGRPDGSPCVGQYGAVTAIPLLRRVFNSLPLSDFRTPQPPTVSQQTICWPLGLPETMTSGQCFVRYRAWILDNKVPLTLSQGSENFSPLLKTFWVDENGNRARPSCGGVKKTTIGTWPLPAEPWLPKGWTQDRLIPLPSKNCPDLEDFSTGHIQITSVFNHSTLTRPTGQASNPSIPLQAMGGKGDQIWFLDQKPVARLAQNSEGTLPMPAPGAYQLSVADEAGHFDMVHFEVISLDE